MNVFAPVTANEDIIAALLRHAVRRSDQTALIALDDGETENARLSYGRLVERVIARAVLLQERGCAGKPVIVAGRADADFPLWVLACMFAGAIAVPMPEYHPRRPSPRWDAVLGQLVPAATIVSPSVAAQAHDQDPPRIASDHPGGAASRWRRPPNDPAAIAFVQFTSGSTGVPKGVIVPQSALTATRAMIRAAFDHGDDWRCVTWLPPWHDMGLVGGLLQPLGEGMEVAVLPPLAVIQKPIRWLRAISRYRATVSGGPLFAFAAVADRIADADLDGIDLSGWQLAYCGAEPVRAATLEAFARRLAPCGFDPAALYPCYGLAEATLFVSGRPRGAGLRTIAVDADALAPGDRVRVSDAGRRLVSCGAPWAGGSLRIADPETGATVAAGIVGEIRVAGPHLSVGYWPLADADRPAELATGDLGFLDAGELFVAGRIKDLIIVRGAKYHPSDIEEQALAAHPALAGRAAAAFAVDAEAGERPMVMIELRGAATDDAEAIETAVAANVLGRCGLRLDRVLLVRPGTIPRTTSGKIERYRCPALVPPEA